MSASVHFILALLCIQGTLWGQAVVHSRFATNDEWSLTFTNGFNNPVGVAHIVDGKITEEYSVVSDLVLGVTNFIGHFATTNYGGMSAEWVTNRLEVPLSILSVQPISTPCPECGGPNHHEIRVQSVAIYDQISVRLVTNAATNTVFDHYGATNVMVRTNIVLKVVPPPMSGLVPTSAYTHPGWTAQPAYNRLPK